MEHSGETASVGALRSAPTLYPAIRDSNIVNNMVVYPIYTEYYSEPKTPENSLEFSGFSGFGGEQSPRIKLKQNYMDKLPTNL